MHKIDFVYGFSFENILRNERLSARGRIKLTFDGRYKPNFPITYANAFGF